MLPILPIMLLDVEPAASVQGAGVASTPGVLHVLLLGLGSPGPGRAHAARQAMVSGSRGATHVVSGAVGYGVRLKSSHSCRVRCTSTLPRCAKGDTSLPRCCLHLWCRWVLTVTQPLVSEGCLCPTPDPCCRRVAPSVAMLASPGICVCSAVPTACPAFQSPAIMLPHRCLGA